MKFCPGCGAPREGAGAFCAGCGKSLAGHQAASSAGAGAPAKNRLTFPLLALIAAALVGAGVWFFFAGGPPTMEEYRDETTQLWEEYFDNAIEVTERIVRRAETAGWIGRHADMIFRSDVEYVLDAFDEYIDGQVRILRTIEALEAPEEMSVRDKELLNDFLAHYIDVAGIAQDTSSRIRSEILPRFGDEIHWWDFADDVYSMVFCEWSGPFAEINLLGWYTERQWSDMDDVNRMARQFNWARTASSATNHHLVDRYLWVWPDSNFSHLAFVALLPINDIRDF